MFLFLAALNQCSEYRGLQRNEHENPQHSRTHTEISLKKNNTVNIVYYIELKHITELYPLVVHSYRMKFYITIWPERCNHLGNLHWGQGCILSWYVLEARVSLQKRSLDPKKMLGKNKVGRIGYGPNLSEATQMWQRLFMSP